MRRLNATVWMLVAAGGLFVACGDDADAGRGGDEPDLEDVVVLDGDVVEVLAQDNAFVEQNIQISPGATVVWENVGRQPHDVVPAAGVNGWGVDADGFMPGDVYEHTFEEPGTYRYYCSLHGDEDAGMPGAIVVE